MADDRSKSLRTGGHAAVDAFLREVRAKPAVRTADPRGRLLFAMDATASREPTWDRAVGLQAEMFEAAASLGGIEVQLCYYRGHGEFHTGVWERRADSIIAGMTHVRCAAGLTQIARVLNHAIDEHKRRPLQALVFVGDVVEESPDALTRLAGQLGVRGLPAFVFQDGHEPGSAHTLRQIAHLSGGAYCPFDHASAAQLKALLQAVAVYCAGGRLALKQFSESASADVRRLTQQLDR